MTELTLNLSESMVLPFDVVSYARFLERDLDKIESRYKNFAATNGATFGNSQSNPFFNSFKGFQIAFRFFRIL